MGFFPHVRTIKMSIIVSNGIENYKSESYSLNLLTKQKETPRHRKQTQGYQRGYLGSGEFGLIYTHCVCVCVCVCVCDSLPGSSVHGVFQTRILERVAISYSRGSFQTRNRTCVSRTCCISGLILYHCATQEAWLVLINPLSLAIFLPHFTKSTDTFDASLAGPDPVFEG